MQTGQLGNVCGRPFKRKMKPHNHMHIAPSISKLGVLVHGDESLGEAKFRPAKKARRRASKRLKGYAAHEDTALVTLSDHSSRLISLIWRAVSRPNIAAA